MDRVVQKSIILNSRTIPPYFQYVERPLQCLSTDAIAKIICFSVDPVMRVWLAGARTNFRRTELGQIFNCFAVGVVIQASPNYEIGTYLFGNLGTANYIIIDQQRQRECFPIPQQLVKQYGQTKFLYLINNGCAAYAGFEIMSPQPLHNVVVSTAAGATGILLCHLLRKHGCRVIGLTSPGKINYLKNHVDLAVDYTNEKELIEVLSSNHFACYFDNVGNRLLDTILTLISQYGRIALCGAISSYRDHESRGLSNYHLIQVKSIKMQGLTFYGVIPKIDQIFEEYRDAKLDIHTVQIKQFPAYFKELLQAGNSITGKVIVRCHQ